MKSLIIAFTLMLSLPTFAAEVLSCKLSPRQTIKISKDNTTYSYSVNGSKASKLASARTVQAKDLKNESILKEILKHMGMPLSQVARANVYQLTDNADGGQTVVHYIFKDETYLAAYVSMGQLAPCL